MFFNSYALSTNLNVVIVAMTSSHAHTLKNGSTVQIKEFDWDSYFRGLALSSYFYGNLSTYILGGWLATQLGGSTLLTLSAFLSSVFTFALPELIQINKYYLVLLRIGLGCSLGVVLPSVNVLWSKWAPVGERARLTSFAISGCFMGRVYVSSVSGSISQYCGWPAVFYITGFFSFLMGIVCGKIVKNEPDNDSYISKEELDYIKLSITTYDCKIQKVPWKRLFTSKPLWAIIVAHFTSSWGLFTILTELPTFLSAICKFNLNTIGFLSAIPYLANIVILQFSGRITDKFFRSEIVSKTNVRKSLICSTFGVQMICINLAGFLNNPAAVMICLIVAIGIDAFIWSNVGVNHLDIATQFAGILMGISCTFAIIARIISPLVAGLIVSEKILSATMKLKKVSKLGIFTKLRKKTSRETSHFQWQCVFTSLGFIYLFGAIFYGIFGSAELQDWAECS